MNFQIYRTLEDKATLEKELNIDVLESSVDEFTDFYKTFTSYLKQADVSIGVTDWKSADYLMQQTAPKRTRLSDEIHEAIWDCKDRGLNASKTAFEIYAEYGVEVSDTTIKNSWAKTKESAPPVEQTTETSF